MEEEKVYTKEGKRYLTSQDINMYLAKGELKGDEVWEQLTNSKEVSAD